MSNLIRNKRLTPLALEYYYEVFLQMKWVKAIENQGYPLLEETW